MARLGAVEPLRLDDRQVTQRKIGPVDRGFKVERLDRFGLCRPPLTSRAVRVVSVVPLERLTLVRDVRYQTTQ